MTRFASSLLLTLLVTCAASAQEGIPLDIHRPGEATVERPAEDSPAKSDAELEKITVLGHYLAEVDLLLPHLDAETQRTRLGVIKRLAGTQLRLIEGFEPSTLSAPLTNAQLTKLFRLRDWATQIQSRATAREAKGLSQALALNTPLPSEIQAGEGELEERLTRVEILSEFFDEYREALEFTQSVPKIGIELREVLKDVIALQLKELRVVGRFKGPQDAATKRRIARLRSEIAAGNLSLE